MGLSLSGGGRVRFAGSQLGAALVPHRTPRGSRATDRVVAPFAHDRGGDRDGLGMPVSTVSAVLTRIAGQAFAAGAARAAQSLSARSAGRAGSHRRQEARPYRGAGHRVTGDAPARRHAPHAAAARGAGWEFVHVCVDDATRLAYVEVLADEKATTAVAFLRRAVAFYARHGVTVERVMTDNGSAYVSTVHALACRLCAPPPAHPALPAADQRQGRALHPHHARRLGLRRDLRRQPQNAPQPLTAGYGPTTIAAHTAPSPQDPERRLTSSRCRGR